MGLEIEEEEKRRPIEMALKAGKKRQRAQTGFVHYCYESVAPHAQDTIPLLENFCFVLALFRSRLSDNVLEAKSLLEKLLAFQVQGNFPVYLHEYPQCRDRMLGVHIFPVLSWIFRDFQNVLGEELKIKLEKTIAEIKFRGQKEHQQRPLSQGALNKLEWIATDWQPNSAKEWADYLISAQLHDQEIQPAMQRWHPTLLTFIKSQKQEKQEPALTLYDLFMGSFFRSFSKRALEDHPVHLQAALIQPISLEDLTSLCRSSDYALAWDESEILPFNLFWGTKGHVHTLVLEKRKCAITLNTAVEGNPSDSKNCADLPHSSLGDCREWILTFPEMIPEEGEGRIEFAFFCDAQEENQIFINSKRANTFQLGDRVEVVSKGLKIQIDFALHSGEGTFFGHISHGNRSSQMSNKGENLFEAYDWQIALRTVQRDPLSSLKLTLTLVH